LVLKAFITFFFSRIYIPLPPSSASAKRPHDNMLLLLVWLLC